jgi:hypothetical protein
MADLGTWEFFTMLWRIAQCLWRADALIGRDAG